MPDIETGASTWGLIVQTIRGLIETNPGQGIIVILLSLVVMTALLVSATWAIVRIIRARNEPHMKNVFTLIRVLTSMMEERDRLSRRHEHMREHSVIRDQMTVTEGTLEEIKNKWMLEISRILSETSEEQNITALPNYTESEQIIDLVLQELNTQLRRSIKENHMAEKTEREFYDYVKVKLSRIKTLTLQNINFRSHTREANDLVINVVRSEWRDVEALIDSMFQSLRHITIKYKKLIDDEETKFNEAWSAFMERIPVILHKGSSPPKGVIDAT